MSKILLLTNNNEDGVGCEILLKMYYGVKAIDVIYCEASKSNQKTKEIIENEKIKIKFNKDLEETGQDCKVKIPPEMQIYDCIFITDLLISAELAKEIDNNDLFKNKILILDHHIESLHLKDYSFAKIKDKVNNRPTCATELIYLELKEILKENNLENYNKIKQYNSLNTIKEFVESIRLYDTFSWKDNKQNPNPLKIHFLFNILGINKFSYCLSSNLAAGILFSSSDEFLINLETERIYSEFKKKNLSLKYRILSNYNCGIVFAENHISLLSDYILEKNKNLDILFLINGESISITTLKDNIDVRQLAKLMGGNGQIKASECSIDKVVIDNYIDTIFTKIK